MKRQFKRFFGKSALIMGTIEVVGIKTNAIYDSGKDILYNEELYSTSRYKECHISHKATFIERGFALITLDL